MSTGRFGPRSYTPLDPNEVRALPAGVALPNIRSEVERIVANVPADKRGAFIAFVEDDGSGPKTDGAAVGMFVNFGHGLSFAGTLKKPWHGALEKSAELIFTF